MSDTTQQKSWLGEAVDALLAWYECHARALPWRGTRDPYRVWLSEILLQQTRIETVRERYRQFLEVYPTVEALAAGEEAELMKLWEGLGYYTRARNLKRSALQIAAQGFPKSAAEWRGLPGVGEYTAGTIASIVLGEAVPAVDGNVVRVLSRLTGRNWSRSEAARLLADWIPEGKAASFTQAWMEAGECLCLPHGEPHCAECPLRPWCVAKRENRISELPSPPIARTRKTVPLTLFLLECGGRYALRRRPEKGVLAGLWEFPSAEGHLTRPEIRALLSSWGAVKPRLSALPDARHLFTHLEWEMRNWRVILESPLPQFTWATPEEIRSRFALPSAFSRLRHEALAASKQQA